MKNCDDEKYDCFEEVNEDIGDIIENSPSERTLAEKSEIFKALSDPTRLKILYLLKNGESCVCHINSALKKPQSSISHHINLLKKSKLLEWRKEGVWIYYKLSNDKIIELIENIEDIAKENEI